MNMILTNEIQKLKSSLSDAIQKWIDEECESAGWQALDTYVSNNISELMADTAFNVLLAQSELSKYYKEEEVITKQ